jgi:hypothetical protein
MSRKILQVGSDILTINDNLVSVKEDYPFWKVNADTFNQFWSRFQADIRQSSYDIIQLTTPDDLQGVQIGSLASPDGIHIYTIPSSANSIMKINTITNVVTYIGNFSGASKYSGGVVVGNYGYFTPFSGSNILKIDFRNDSVTTFGNFIGTLKWGKPCLAQNGIIYCPPYNASDWLIINPVDDSTRLVSKGVGGSYTACCDGGNGFIYACAGGANSNVLKLDIENETNTLVTVLSTGTNPYGDITNVNGILFLAPHTFGSFAFINTLDDSVTYMTHPNTSTVGKHISCKVGPDGWVYFPKSSTSLVNSFRINSLNFTLEQFITSPVSSSLAFSKNGKMYFIPANTANSKPLQITDELAEPLSDNMFLNRFINKG